MLAQEQQVTPEQFEASVKGVVKMKAQLAVLQAEARSVREALAHHKDIVTTYMSDSGVHNVSYKDHTIRFRTAKKKCRPTIKKIKDDKSFFKCDADYNYFFSKFDELTEEDVCETITISKPRPKKSAEDSDSDSDSNAD